MVWCLGRRIPEYILTVGIKSHAPESDACHDLFSTLQLAIATENAVNEFASAVLAHDDLLGGLVAFGILQHELLANLEEFVEARPQSFTALDKIFDKLVVVFVADAWKAFLGSLDFAGELD